MNQYKFKSLFLALFAVSLLHAQVYKDTKKSTFKVSKNALLEIDASHTDVIIETWNKKTVAIEATISVEGVSEKKAKSIIKKWEFEALGNKNKVKITSKSGDREFFSDENFVFNFEGINFPEMDIDLEALSKIEFREIDFPDIHLEKLSIPEISEIKILENFNFSNYKNDTSYVIEWKERVREGVDRLRNSEWRVQIDSLRNSKEFKHEMEVLKREMTKLRNDFKDGSRTFIIDQKELHNELQKELQNVKKETEKVILILKNEWTQDKRDSLNNAVVKFRENSFQKREHSPHRNVKKHLKIKVPMSMKFDLNIRHGKVELPKGVNQVSATISYGEFISKGLGEGKHQITINNAPVQIQHINSGSINLKNVPYAWFGTFSNASLFVNSGEVVIDKIGENASLNQKFGTLSIHHLAKDFKQLNVVLDYAKGNFSFVNTPLSFIISNKESRINMPSSFVFTQSNNNAGVGVDSGYQQEKESANKLILTGIYSTVNIN